MASLKEIGEFKLIDMIKKSFSALDKESILGIGDDCAVIKKDTGTVYLVSTDLLTEGVHFDLDYFSPKQIGKRAALVNISDIAAMGGKPKFMLASFSVPERTGAEFVSDIFVGMKSVMKRYGMELIGGDLSSSRAKIFLSITVIGEAGKWSYKTRKGAKPGDSIYVTGKLGDSSGGLYLFKKDAEIDKNAKDYLKKKHVSVTPRVMQGEYLAGRKAVTSMIDLSDGVGSDIKRICGESRVGAKIFTDSLPVSTQLKKLAKSLGRDLDRFALYGGEDYELMFTVKKGGEEKLKSGYKKKFKRNLYKIGEITKKREFKAVSKTRKDTPLLNSFDHFSD